MSSLPPREGDQACFKREKPIGALGGKGDYILNSGEKEEFTTGKKRSATGLILIVIEKENDFRGGRQNVTNHNCSYLQRRGKKKRKKVFRAKGRAQ